jgi:hypothetical protein
MITILSVKYEAPKEDGQGLFYLQRFGQGTQQG